MHISAICDLHLTLICIYAGYDKELKKAKWLSLLNHICNTHEGHGGLFPNCAHDDIEERDWIVKGST